MPHAPIDRSVPAECQSGGPRHPRRASLAWIAGLAGIAAIAALSVVPAPPGPGPRPGQLVGSADLDRDGVADQIHADVGFDAVAPETGSVRVVSGATGSELYRVEGGAPNARFGYSVAAADLDGNGSLELVVTAPNAPEGGSGRVSVYRGDTGRALRAIAAPAGTRLGLDVRAVPDQDHDGGRDLLIEGARLEGGEWRAETFLYSGSSGRLLSGRHANLGGLARFAEGGGLLYAAADLDDSGAVDQLDVLELAALAGAADVDGRGDLDGNGTVNAFDAQLALQAYLAGTRTVAGVTTLSEIEGEAQSAASRWQDVYGDAVLTLWDSRPTHGAPSSPSDPGPGLSPNAVPTGVNGLDGSFDTIVGDATEPFPPYPPGIGLQACACSLPSLAQGTTSQQCEVWMAGCPQRTLRVGETVELSLGSYPGPDLQCRFVLVNDPNDPAVVEDPSAPGTFRAERAGCAEVYLVCGPAGDFCCGCSKCVICVEEEAEPVNPCEMVRRIEFLDCPAEPIAPWQLHDALLRIGVVGIGEHMIAAGPEIWWSIEILPPGSSCAVTPQQCEALGLCTEAICGLTRTGELIFNRHPAWEDLLDLIQNPVQGAVVCVRARVETPECSKCVSCALVIDTDTDGDGLFDQEETDTFGTLHDDPDTDGDGYCDGLEVAAGTAAAGAGAEADRPSGWWIEDRDRDGLPGHSEVFRNSFALPAPSTGGLGGFDFDRDYVGDGDERELGLNPHAVSSTGPDLPDRYAPAFLAADADRDFLSDTYELRYGLDPTKRDMDGDGIPDGVELRAGTDPTTSHRNESPDSDGDGICDYEEEWIYRSDPGAADSDGDGLLDGFEVFAGLNPRNRSSDQHVDPVSGFVISTGFSDWNLDLDRDGLVNGDEQIYSTDPLDPDSDDDGTTDGDEIEQGSHPGWPGDGGEPSDSVCWVRLSVMGGTAGSACSNPEIDPDGPNGPQPAGPGAHRPPPPHDYLRCICECHARPVGEPDCSHCPAYFAATCPPFDGPGNDVRVTVGSGGLTRPDGTPVPPIPVTTGPGGRLKAADLPLVRGRCYPLDLTVRGPGSGYHVSLVPIDRPGPQAQPCYGCCCMQLHEELGDPPPPGGTRLGNHCGGELPENKRVELCLPLVDPDPATHTEPDTLTVLPGDDEIVYVSGVPRDSTVRITDPTVAKFVDGEDLVESIDIPQGRSGAPAAFAVRGLKNGSTTLVVEHETGPTAACEILPVAVGGRIVLTYDRAPTFKVPSSGGGGGGGALPPNLGPRGPGDPPPPDDLEWGWGPVLTPGGRPTIPDQIIVDTNQIPAVRATFRVEVRDALGNPKKGKLIAISSDGDKIAPAQVHIGLTDATGRATTELEADYEAISQELIGAGFPAEHIAEAGVARDNLAVMVGRAAQMFGSGELTPAALGTLRFTNEHVVTSHTFTGHSLRYSREFVTQSGDTYVTTATLDVPAINHTQYMLAAKHFVGGILGQPAIPPQTAFSILDPSQLPDDLVYENLEYGPEISPEAFLNEPATPGDLLGPRAHPGPFEDFLDRLTAEYAGNELMDRPVDDPALAGWEELDLAAPEAPDPLDPPPGWQGKLITFGAISAEIALALVPGGDAIDLSRSLWKWWVWGEEPDWLGMALAASGVVFDLIPGNVLGNFAIGAFKAINKFLPPGAGEAILRMSGNFVTSAKDVIALLGRIPAPPGSNQLGRAIHASTAFTNQVQRVVASRLNLTTSHLTKILPVLARRATRHFSDEAVEGFSYAAKHGREAVIEGMFDAGTGYSEDVVEASLDSLRYTYRYTGELAALSDEAIRGVGAATEAVGPGSALVREFIEGTVVDGARASLAFRNLERLRGVDGLDEMVAFLRNNANNANLPGAIYEGTVARRILDGEVPGAGSLQRVSADGLDDVDRVDTLTANWAVQIKHRDGGGQFSVNYWGFPDEVATERARAYVREFVENARAKNKTPVWVTNGGVNDHFSTEVLRHVEQEYAEDGIVIEILTKTVPD